MLRDNFRLAVDGLRRRKLRSWLTMLGIFIGIAAVVSLIGLGEGLRTAITSQFDFLATDILTIQASGVAMAGMPGTGTPNPLTDDLAGKIEKVGGVEAAINRYMKTGTIEFNDRQQIGMAMSMPSGEHREFVEIMLNAKAEQGRLLKDGDGRKVFLGNRFSREGMFGKGMKAGDRLLLSGVSYEVVGIMERKGNFMMEGAVVVNDEPLLRDFGDDGSVNIMAVKVKDENKIDQIKQDIEKLLRKERGVKEGEEDFTVESPQAMIETLNSTLFAVQLFVYMIAAISLLVGGIGIMNTMYTAVIERTKEIGIMKSIGAKNSTIFTLFSIESGLLGLVGGLIGVVLGLIFAYGMAFVGRMVLGVRLIQAYVSLELIIGALMFSFIVGMIAGVLPAMQASRLHPVEALRSVK